MRVISSSDKETQKHGMELGKRLSRGLLCLYGELGAGKTTFVQGLAKGLSVKSKVASPTFTYQKIHKGRVKLYHFDCYRLEKPDALLIEEIREALKRNDGIVAVEWAEKIESFLPAERINIRIGHKSEKERSINLDL